MHWAVAYNARGPGIVAECLMHWAVAYNARGPGIVAHLGENSVIYFSNQYNILH